VSRSPASELGWALILYGASLVLTFESPDTPEVCERHGDPQS
jgi:hypothetical protein